MTTATPTQNPPPKPTSIHDPTLLPSILPRISHIVDLLQTVGRESGTAGPSTSTSASAQPADVQVQSTQAHPHTQPLIPSIALGSTSDDDAAALYDFLNSQHGSEGTSGGGSTVPHHLTLELVREAKALRETYAEVERRVREFEEGEWATDEVQGAREVVRERVGDLRSSNAAFLSVSDEVVRET